MKILILAAGSIQSRLSYIKPNFDTPALIPINSKSVIKLILDFYYTNLPNSDIYIATNKDNISPIQDELNNFQTCNFIEVPTTDGVNDTLRYCLQFFNIEDSILINLVTTIPTLVANVNEVLLSNELESSNYYSSISVEDKVSFNFKKNREKKLGYPFTGIFCLKKIDLLQAIENTLEANDLLSVVDSANKLKKIYFIYTNWIDVGHEINYFKSRKKILFSRSFNKIEISRDNTITKKSSDKEKFENEVRYVDMLPYRLKQYYPKVLDEFKIIDNIASIKMEYYAYPNISEYQLYWKFEAIYWERLFENLGDIIGMFRKNKFSIGKKAYFNFYYKKTCERYYSFKESIFKAGREELLNSTLQVNGRNLKSFEDLMQDIYDKIDNIYNEDDFCIMHGDLCFNNILYDYVGDSVKLIDPRGSFGDLCIGIYGDIKYDLAKLLHSSMYGYDYIVNDLFSLKMTNNNYLYQFKFRDNQQLLNLLSIDLIEKLGYNSKDICFIIGLLFISMCPLHSDSFERQIVMYLHGLTILNDNL